MTLVIATGGIDLSVGSLMAIAGALAPIIFLGKIVKIPEIHVAVAVAMIVSILVAGAFGWFNGWLITRFRIQPIIATLVLFIAGRGIAQVSTNGNLQPFKLDEFQWIGLGRIFAPDNPTANGFKGIPDQVFIMVVIVALAAWALNRSLFGRQILAIGGNERAARLAGVPVATVKRWVYCISGLCAGVAGLVHIAINSSSDANLVGMGMELDAIAAVAVGGTLLSGGRATVTGTLIGALIIQLVRYTLLANGVPDDAAKLVKAALIVARGLAARPREGLSGEEIFARLLPREPGRPDRARRADPVRLAALRQFSRAVQHLVGAALQFDVRAGGSGHVLRHHDGRHRPIGRRDGGVRQRGRGDSEPLRNAGGRARRDRRGSRSSACSTASSSSSCAFCLSSRHWR